MAVAARAHSHAARPPHALLTAMADWPQLRLLA
jgi:hypothetical protein